MNDNDNQKNERRRPFSGRRKKPSQGNQSAQKPDAPNNEHKQLSKKNRRQNDRQQNKDKKNKNSGPDRALFRDKAAEAKNQSKNQHHAQINRERQPQVKIIPPILPKPICPRCSQVIEDIASAINDKDTGEPVHFDCIVARISEAESLAADEKVVYLGGGRFGVVTFENPNDLKKFKVKKIIAWEEKDKRLDWRRQISDMYSTT